jgi:methyl-accepting chemotaxis protein
VRVELGYKFILGFVLVVAAVAFTPVFLNKIIQDEWLWEPLSFLIAITIGLFLAAILSRGLTKKFRRLSDLANSIGIGDLTGTVELSKGKVFFDETSDLAYSIHEMQQNLKDLINHIKNASHDIIDASTGMENLLKRVDITSSEIKKAMDTISIEAHNQVKHLEESLKLIRGMTEAAHAVSSNAQEMVSSASEAHRTVKHGAFTSNKTIEKLRRVFEEIERSREMILSLDKKIQYIPKILDVINHASRETDQLAISATMAASKAGEEGRGFAVVAEKVRKCANDTSRSSDEVALIINEVKEEMQKVVTTFEDSTDKIREGREDVLGVQENLEKILSYVEKVKEKSEEIAEISEEQRKGAQRTISVSGEVSKIVDTNLTTTGRVYEAINPHRTSVEEVSHSLKKLLELAQELEWVVMKFKVDEEFASKEKGLPVQ